MKQSGRVSIPCGARVMLRGHDGGVTDFVGQVLAVNGGHPRPYVVAFDMPHGRRGPSREYDASELVDLTEYRPDSLRLADGSLWVEPPADCTRLRVYEEVFAMHWYAVSDATEGGLMPPMIPPDWIEIVCDRKPDRVGTIVGGGRVEPTEDGYEAGAGAILVHGPRWK